MRSAFGVLNNAAKAANLFKHKAPHSPNLRWCLSDEDTYGVLSADVPALRSLASQWHQESFWISERARLGFPLLAFECYSEFVGAQRKLEERGLRVYMARNATELHDCLFRGVTLYFGETLNGVRPFNAGRELCEELVNWLVDPWPLGCTHSDAYSKFVQHPLGITEDVWGELGAWAWGDFEELVRAAPKNHLPVDTSNWLRLCDSLAKDDRSSGLVALDALCQRQSRHKRRHYFDVCTLYALCGETWDTQGQGDVFRRTARAVLYSGLRGGVGHERLYLTCFWLWTTPYWQDLCAFFLQWDLFSYGVDDYRAICKEITARVTASWMFPMSNVQHIASAYFLNAEDLTGFADNQESSGEVALEVLEFALNDFEYTAPGTLGRDFESYLSQFSSAVESMLEPLYREFRDRALPYEELLATRAAWGAGGVAGRRAREVLGTEKAPPGCTKAYAMVQAPAQDFAMDWGTTRNEIANKMDERGPPRCITATDMRDQISETFAFRHFSNRYPSIGLDIGESPTQAMARHAKLAGCTRGKRHYMVDGRLITAWDWMKWDHFYHCAEKVLVLQAMRRLTARWLRGEVRGQLIAEIDDLISKHEEMVYRSQTYADAEYSKRVDELIAQHGDRASRLPGDAGATSVLIKRPNGQQSGRKTTLECNTIVGTARLLVRDAELLGRRAALGHRVALYTLNRADDVAEVHATYAAGVAAVNKMIEQGHRANPKKQVAQWRSVVYLRNLYAGGSMRAFPPRAVYAAATGHPDKGAGSESSYMDKLRSVSKGLDMWMRRGGWMRMARCLYADAEKFFSSTRVWHDHGGVRRFSRVKIAVAVLRAAPENGGLGILPPGCYTYDYAVKCRTHPRYADIADAWEEQLAPYAKRTVGPGIHDLEGVGRKWLTDSTGLVPTDAEVKAYKDKWARGRMHQGGDGQTRFLQRCAQVARSVKRWHRDVKDSVWGHRIHEHHIIRSTHALRDAIDVGAKRPDSSLPFDILRGIRGLPGYAMVEHLWHGYGQVMMGRRRLGPDALKSLCVRLASASQLGRDFLALSRHWSAHAMADHLTGNLGPAGAWDKLIPPSWSGWFVGTVALCMASEIARNPKLTNTRYGLLKLRAQLSNVAAHFFVENFPELCLH
ncbi:putative RNA-dependent RNA polymerase [Dactylonectria torresensis alternavirus 1]|nr:putative RNA-dependent RNA polymerase [Dactylonectria torresensis alternavirus 1]